MATAKPSRIPYPREMAQINKLAHALLSNYVHRKDCVIDRF